MSDKWRRHRPLFSRPPAPAAKPAKEKRRFVILPFLWKGVKRLAMVIGFLVLLNVTVAALTFILLPSPSNKAANIDSGSVLFMVLEEGFQETHEFSGLTDAFAPPKPTLRQLVAALNRGAKDERIKGLIARMNDGSFDLSQSAELRAAIENFKAAGKFTYLYSSSLGEGGGGLGRYYLASAFDEIWMQPLGIVSITGISAEIPFARDALEKLGVTPQFFQRKEYKTAYESITNREISRANREEMSAIINDMRKLILTDVPKDRDLPAARLDALVNKGLFMADEAVTEGLIDHADYADAMLDAIALAHYGEADSDLIKLVNMDAYALERKAKEKPSLSASIEGKPSVALVYAVGAIMPSAGEGGFGGQHLVSAEELAPVLYGIAEDESIDAIILRIDSPGGSPTASESILRALQSVQKSGKPVIVSMGATAASGGYWIAAYADRIFAMPTTLTGSIGVVGGKFALDGLSEKLGINWERLEWGENAGLWSMSKPFTPSEAERMNALMDHIYENFKIRVAEGRKLSPERVEQIARGRVWSGMRAVDVGLVDELGGLSAASEYTAKLLGQDSAENIEIVVMPKPKTAWEEIIGLLGGETSVVFNDWRAVRASLQPVLEVMDRNANPQNYMVYDNLSFQ